MDLQLIQSFVEVAKLLNFSRAADKLHVTQSSMSARIQKLETDLGVPLFVREAKGIRLSKFGEVFLPYAMQCIDTMDSGVKRIEEEKDRIFSKLTISAANPLASLILPQILTALHEAVPELRIQVIRNTGYSDEILRMVTESQIDIGFFNHRELLHQAGDGHPVKVVPLYEDDFVLLAKSTHPVVHREKLTPENLSEQSFVVMGTKTSVTQHIMQYFHVHDIQPKSVIEINSIPGLKEMLKNTEMLTFLPRLVAMNELEKGDLVEVALATPPDPIITFLAYQPHYCQPAVIKIIKDRVETVISTMDFPIHVFSS